MSQYRPTGFQLLPTVVKNLLIINGLVFLAQTTLVGPLNMFSFDDVFALHALQSNLFKPWQIITHLFMHANFGHILGNMLGLWMFGSVLENVWGSKKFLFFYAMCGIGAAVLHLGILSVEFIPITNQYNQLLLLSKTNPAAFNEAFLVFSNAHNIPIRTILQENHVAITTPGISGELMDLATAYYQKMMNTATLGASGAVFGILIAFVYLFPNTYIYIYFLFPIKAKYLGILYFSYELYFAIQNSAGDDVARWAHVGGAIVGFILVFIWKRKSRHHFN
jgi:membrane associated rhomboid family serine protease